MINDDELRQIMPHLIADKRQSYLGPLRRAMREFEINTWQREAAFLAQLAHESGELRFFEELWGPTPRQLTYEGRKDLGNTDVGDGYKFRGRGPIQLTGRANYKTFGEMLGLDLINKPELVATPKVGFRVAGAYWQKQKLNVPSDAEDFVAVTKGINPQLRGQDDREKYYARAKLVLSHDDASQDPIMVIVNGEELLDAAAFFVNQELMVKLRPIANALALRILEARLGRAILQDTDKQNYRLPLLMVAGVGYVPFLNLPGSTIFNAATRIATLKSKPAQVISGL